MRYEKALQKARRIKEMEQQGRPFFLGGVTEAKSPVYTHSKNLLPDLDSADKHICLRLNKNSPVLDYYKVLRTQILQRTQRQGHNTIMITSIMPGEGKTLTSINLALTFAKSQNHTVLLVDGDLRCQQVHKYLGLESPHGLADYLANDRSLQDLIVWPNVERFTFISGGENTTESSELIGSNRMQRLMKEFKQRYPDRYVFFDSAPLLGGDDALTLSAWVDGIVLVVESHKTPLRLVEEALELIPKEKFLGFVLNKNKLTNNDLFHSKGVGQK